MVCALPDWKAMTAPGIVECKAVRKSMRTIHHPSELSNSGQSVCAAIGVFDGVHIGHQSVIRRMLDEAAESGAISVVVTFDRHPRSLITPHAIPPLIQTQAQKLRVFEKMGTHAVWMIRFDLPFSQISGKDFIVSMQQGFGSLTSVCVGTEFHFGHQRSGNARRLAEWGKSLHFSTHAMSAVEFEGRPVSSTRVRESIQQGELELAAAMLGRPYALAGKVIQGNQLGRTIGFPTANLETPGMVVPPPGVYAASCRLAGRIVQAAVNIGFRPTLNHPEPARLIEAHLIDWSGDLYGEEIELSLVRRIRPEQKFPSLDALKQQIQADVQAVKAAKPLEI